MLKKIPLSKLPSPKSSVETSVNVAKAPNFTPFENVLDNSNVVPISPAKYSPAEIFKSKEEYGPNRIGPTFLEENYGTIEINSNKNITMSIKNINQQTINKINVKLS